jgi:exonuclease VII large subunit
MKGMLQVQDRLKIQRESITQLLNQLTDEYPTLKSELKQISEQDSGSDDEYTFLEEFELLIVSVSGYAKQIQATGSVKQLDSTVAHLQQLQVFANAAIAQFYTGARRQYPEVQSYLQLLNYLRLLMLEYLQMQQTIQPISA